jgi:hypothetical protein
MFPAMVRRDVLILLAAKAAALTLIYVLFVTPQPAFSARDIQAHILSTSSTTLGHHDGHR